MTVIDLIKQNNAKLVCVQVPDGMKPQTKEIADGLRDQTDAEVIIWAGSCFGACDLALEAEQVGADLLIQWGHTPWKYRKE